MSKTHWKKLYNYDYLGSQDLPDGNDISVTIQSIKKEMVTSEGGRKEECNVVRFQGVKKPMILNKTNARTITKLYKTPYIEDWIGKSITLFVKHDIKFRGDLVEGLRIRPVKPKIQNANNEYNVKFQELKGLLTKYKGDDLEQIRANLNKHHSDGTLNVQVLTDIIAKVR